MTTRSEALKVMTVVAACHHRTAPRMDDPDVARATADIWAELFSRYNLALPDLIAAVKQRALKHPEAPEPAEIIAVAREIRRDRAERENANPALRAAHEDVIDRKVLALVTALADRKAIERNAS